MALIIDVKGIKDWEDLVDSKGKFISVTESLAMMTMWIGVPDLTDKTSREFWRRAFMYEQSFGALLSNSEGSRYTTWLDVKRHIGLKTNAAPMTTAGFKKNVIKNMALEMFLKADRLAAV